jgi:rubredoxin
VAEVDTSVEWMCGVCRYVYTAQTGDPKGNNPAGTPFEELPDDWVCPVCGVGKEKFFDV